MGAIEPRQVNRPRLVVLFITTGILAGLGVILLTPDSHRHKTIDQQTIEWLGNPRKIDSFSLSSTAETFNNDSLKGRWTIILFGFLNCPDICPTSMAQLAALRDKIEEDNIKCIFVSVDPQRDSVELVHQYAQSFHRSITGITGTTDQLERLTSSLGIQFSSTRGDDYTVAHSITFSIIAPDGTLKGRFRPGFDPEVLAQQLQPLLLGFRNPS